MNKYETLLGIKVDTKLNFNEHLNDIIRKASHKVNALSKVVPYKRKYILHLGYYTFGAERVNSFGLQKKYKKWQPKNCSSRLCKLYVSNLGFITNT